MPTNTPIPTNTPVPTRIQAQGPTPTEAQLPNAGVKIPALGGIVIGLILVSLGVVLVF